MCSEHALSLIQSLVAKRQRSCVAQSVEQSPGLREVLGSNPGTADQCFSAITDPILLQIPSYLYPPLRTLIDNSPRPYPG